MRGDEQAGWLLRVATRCFAPHPDRRGDPTSPRGRAGRGLALASQIDGGAGLGLTYVTGALVKVGQLLAVSLTGGPRWGWAPNLLLWAALVAGSAAGALAYVRIYLAAIWFAAGAALALSAAVAVAMRRRALDRAVRTRNGSPQSDPRKG